MNFERDWTIFAVDAEVDHFGTARLVKAHNDLRKRNRKLEAVVELVPHIHNPATCEIERKARVTTYFDSHGPEPCQMCDALADLEDGE